MRFIFKKHRRPVADISAEGVLQKQFLKGYSFVQSGWAKWMAKTTQKWSRKKLIVVSVLFFTITGAYSMYLIIDSLTTRGVQTINIERILPLSAAIKIKGGVVKHNTLTNDRELERIGSFSKYIDSLSQSPTGRDIYDSIASKRPGLLDSLQTIEYYYKLNFKN
jgi:hypothetical protein